MRVWLSNSLTGETVWLEGFWQLGWHGDYAFTWKTDGDEVQREWVSSKFTQSVREDETGRRFCVRKQTGRR
eukprot:2516946-Lingulodinium_polyedra.AAC.1